jgi:hypothetical protein
MTFLLVVTMRRSQVGIFLVVYRVIKKIGEASYRPLLPDHCQLHPVFHVSQLKKHIGPRAIQSPDLPLVGLDGNIIVAPEAILPRRVVRRNNEPVA